MIEVDYLKFLSDNYLDLKIQIKMRLNFWEIFYSIDE